MESSNPTPGILRRDELDKFIPHVISLGDNGRLESDGGFASNAEELADQILPRFKEITKDWESKRIVIYAHGGLVSARSALKDISKDIEKLKQHNCYLLAFVWRTGPIETIFNQLRDDWDEQGGTTDSRVPQLDDMVDKSVEQLVRATKLRDLWSQMKGNARQASETDQGGARLACEIISRLLADESDIEIHLISHSAGSIFQGHFLDYLTGPKADQKLGLKVNSCSLWAPACTIDFFKEKYMPAISTKRIERLSLMTLNDDSEQGDTAWIYNKSLLYLVSRAFEEESDHGEVPLLGMERYVKEDPEIIGIEGSTWTLVPNHQIKDCHSHGSFSENAGILEATLNFITTD